MSEQLLREIRQSRSFGSLEEATFLSLQRTASLWMQVLSHKLRPFELTPTQYNVLRILRGAHPGSLTCTQVGERMVTPVPDVTRLLDRLLARRLVWKARDDSDRRIRRVEISGGGLDLLASIDEEILGWLEEMLSPLEQEEMRILGALAAKARRN